MRLQNSARTHCVTICNRLRKEVVPLSLRRTGVMHSKREKEGALSVDEEAPVVVGHGVRRTTKRRVSDYARSSRSYTGEERDCPEDRGAEHFRALVVLGGRDSPGVE